MARSKARNLSDVESKAGANATGGGGSGAAGSLRSGQALSGRSDRSDSGRVGSSIDSFGPSALGGPYPAGGPPGGRGGHASMEKVRVSFFPRRAVEVWRLETFLFLLLFSFLFFSLTLLKYFTILGPLKKARLFALL